ncbi:O-methyltransferase [Erwinia persicina]|uniref:O-methyltransferase n=1 Tax=Erwinia persicina TaxID=55211 RepID=A0A3S5GTD7_9GAMM|nr:O-methyltransferase [Erwinia persicina]AXU94630.1 O-methyltransferase [Erwinia persicina]MBC3947097.1 O-methyltransferase [Erwinia persicina]MBD8108807.1 O-methyltransferase [Erwinia persicina]MBD8211907.1 O-methyltransferase [Erwinia persicina]TKJ90017.1 O-methyltransferase [Erwinia persicina]
MNQQRWTEVDNYLTEQLVPQDEALLAALENNQAAGLPAIDVAPNQGKLLNLLAKMTGAKRILEIGTLGGYSTLWLARALPDGGKVITLEYEPHHAEIAAQNIRRAGLEHKVTLRVGAALDTLPTLADAAPFDMIFIDADKRNNPAYLEWAIRYSRPGTLIIGDNVVRNGHVADGDTSDWNIQGIRDFLTMMGSDPRLDATAIQTVGAKGWDGFSLALVK